MEKNNIKTNDRIKKWYWILIIIFSVIVLPFIFNKLILNERYWDVVGEGKDWLMFWPSYLSAIASAVMIEYTATTLKNNQEQLDELKRQWDEEHTPKVSVSFNFIKPYAYLRFDNISNVEVKDFSMKLELYQGKQLIRGFIPPDKQQIIDNLKINIEPKGIRTLVIRDDLGGLTNNESILLYLKYNGEEKEPIRILCNNIFSVGDNILWYAMKRK